MLVGLALLGFLSNVWLYVDDVRNRGGVLNLVHRGNGGEERDTVVLEGESGTSENQFQSTSLNE